MTPPPEVSVVIVTYNAADWVRRCLRALLQEARPARSFEVVVVDNASDTATREVLAEFTGLAHVVPLDSNIGFGNACNLGVSLSSGRTVLLLNPDAVLRPGAVDALVDLLDAEPRRGLVGGRTLRPDGSVDPSSCWGAPSLWSLWCFATGLSTAFRRNRLLDPESLGSWPRDSIRQVDIVTGCLLATTRATWDSLGGFDPDYFMYGEDADLSLRARRAGLEPSITPDAVAVHAVGASSGSRLSKQLLLFRGKSTLLRKQWTPGRARVGTLLLVLGVAARATGERLRGRPGMWSQLLAARADWTRGWPAVAAPVGEKSSAHRP